MVRCGDQQKREATLVPLFLKSYLRAPTWLVIGLGLSLVGGVLALAAMTAGKGVGAAGVVVLLLGLTVFCRGLVVLTEKVRLAGDHVARVTALSRCKIAWGQVELYATGLLVTCKPFHARYCLEGGGRRIRFRTRTGDYAGLDALLRGRCTNAFHQDCLTGWITAPAGGRHAARTRQRFRRIARRTSRRYTLLAVAQVVALPVVFVVGSLIVLKIGGFPSLYALSDIGANFRRAANARRSFRQYEHPA
jgi:hypothetical protein